MTLDLERALDTARRAVELAGKASLKYFDRGVHVEKKADRSPVTKADHDAEKVIVETIRDAFPDHSILAEESGAMSGDPHHRWIVDPLDGTRGFTRGGKFWGPLVALEAAGEVVVGAMALPVLGEIYWAAKGHGTFRNGTRLGVSKIDDWREATLSLGEIQKLIEEPHGGRVLELVATAASTRGYGDLAGLALVLNGQAEVWLESGVKPWDIAPAKILTEEAGGRFTDFQGIVALDSGQAIASNGLLHAHVLHVMRR